MELHVEKGIGRVRSALLCLPCAAAVDMLRSVRLTYLSLVQDHAKWSPVATASYRLLPEVRCVYAQEATFTLGQGGPILKRFLFQNRGSGMQWTHVKFRASCDKYGPF